MTIGRIDTHAHLIPDFYRLRLLKHGIVASGGFPFPPWTPDLAINFMDDYGIQAQLVCLSEPGVTFVSPAERPALAREVNDYCSDVLIGQYGTRFGAYAVLPMPDAETSATEARRALTEGGLDGVVLQSSYDGLYLGDPSLRPLLEELDRLGAWVFVHPSAPPADAKPPGALPDFLYEFTFDTTRAVANLVLSGDLRRFPNIRWQLAHAGGTIPFVEDRLESLGRKTALRSEIAERVRNAAHLRRGDVRGLIAGLYYDTALAPSAMQMGGVLGVSTMSHIVFGSDWPFASLVYSGGGDPQPDLDDTFSSAKRARVDAGNALEQFPRLAKRLKAAGIS